jgi:hypothetical protein
MYSGINLVICSDCLIYITLLYHLHYLHYAILLTFPVSFSNFASIAAASLTTIHVASPKAISPCVISSEASSVSATHMQLLGTEELPEQV